MTTCAISAYHNKNCEFEPRSWRGVLDTTLCDQVCQRLAKGQWFYPVSSTNKTDRHNMPETMFESGVKHYHKLPPIFKKYKNNSHSCCTNTVCTNLENMNHYSVMLFNATFTNISVISWGSILLVEDIGVPRENHRSVASHRQNLSHNILSSTPHHEWDSNSQLWW